MTQPHDWPAIEREISEAIEPSKPTPKILGSSSAWIWVEPWHPHAPRECCIQPRPWSTDPAAAMELLVKGGFEVWRRGDDYLVGHAWINGTVRTLAGVMESQSLSQAIALAFVAWVRREKR